MVSLGGSIEEAGQTISLGFLPILVLTLVVAAVKGAEYLIRSVKAPRGVYVIGRITFTYTYSNTLRKQPRFAPRCVLNASSAMPCSLADRLYLPNPRVIFIS